MMSKMRIIGGQSRGKRLVSPSDRSIRPTSDRAREALFSMLDHRGLIEDARFLDLFCGTGAVGLEAWSRGAGDVWLIDRDIALASSNVDALGRPLEVRLCRMDAANLGPPSSQFDIVFLDPPYRSGLAGPALDGLLRGWLADEALVVVELAAKDNLVISAGYGLEQERQYGTARFLFLRPDGQPFEAGSA